MKTTTNTEMVDRAARAEKARGTAWEAIYTKPAPPEPRVMTKEELAAERNRVANRERARAKRAGKKAERHSLHSLSSRTGAMSDNKQYANWTI